MRFKDTKGIAAAALLAAVLLSASSAHCLSLGGLFGSPVDSDLVAQVPQNKRAAINKAEYELACAREDTALAELKEELADKQDDLANLVTKLAKTQGRGAEIAHDIAKMEAIMASGLGKAEDNRTVMNDLLTDRIKNEAERIQNKSKVDQATLYVRDWTNRVANKEKSVAEFKSRRSSADASVPAAKPAAQSAAQPVEEPVTIINKEPGVAPVQPAGVPETDLKN